MKLKIILLLTIQFLNVNLLVQAQTEENSCSGSPDNPSWLVVIKSGKRRFAGTLIDKIAVLTAAHLINRTQELTVEINGTKRNVKQIHEHSQFNSRLMYFDVAILELNDSVVDAAPACLPDQDNDIDYSQCSAVVMKSTGEVENLSLRTLNRRICERLLRRKLGTSFELHSSFRCAKGSCQIHGGSALICPTISANETQQSNWVHIGVSSWGLECGTAPEVYVDVKHVLPWIQTVLNERIT